MKKIILLSCLFLGACDPLSQPAQVAVQGIGTVAATALCQIAANQTAKVKPGTNAAIAATTAFTAVCANPSATVQELVASYQSVATTNPSVPKATIAAPTS